MNETQLLRICLSVAVIGIVSLFFLTKTLEAKEVKISSITPEYIGQTISTSGTVSKIAFNNEMTFITLEADEENFPVVFFQEIKDVFSGEQIVVSGKVQEYKGNLQIVGEHINFKKI